MTPPPRFDPAALLGQILAAVVFLALIALVASAALAGLLILWRWML